MRIGLIFLVLLFFQATSQTTVGLNELFKIINTSKPDTVRINALIEAGNIYQNLNPDSAIYYHLLSKDLSRKINDPLKTISSFNELTWDYLLKGDFKNAIQMYEGANFVIKKVYHTGDQNLIKKTKRLEGACVTNVASVYKEKGEYTKALDFYFKAVAINEETGNKNSKGSTFSNIASVYSSIGDLVKAIEYNYKALKIFEETDNKLYQAGVLGNMGLVYSKQNNHAKALEYHLKSKKMYVELNSKHGEATCLENIGIEYSYLENPGMSLDYFFKALKINEEQGNIFGVGQCCGDIAISYQLLADTLMAHGKSGEAAVKHQFAMDYYLKAINISREIGNKQGEGFNLMGLASLYASLGEYNKAIKYNRQAESIAVQIGSLNDLKEVHYTYYKIYKQAGQAGPALSYLKKYVKDRDSILNEENTKASIEHEMKFLYEKKFATDSVKSGEEKKIILAKLIASHESLKAEKTLRYSLYGGIIALILFAAGVLNRFNVISNQKQLIQKQKQLAEHQKQLVEEKQKEIIDSIHYAKRIQTAMLTSEKYIERILNELRRG
ncbi:MAG: tetratricopeptide repeat protein [Bacteroidia bacterium]